MSSITLLALNPEYIVEYIAGHPITWDDRELSKRGGPGDMAGPTPTPAVQEFLALLSDRKGLFTQHDFAQHCWNRWGSWLLPMPGRMRLGVKAKLYNNFYPSMIDSLHVWAMLAKAGWFQVCILDSFDDAVGKADLTLVATGYRVKLGLLGPTARARTDRDYKKVRRAGPDDAHVVEVQLDGNRQRSPGNKRWFALGDFWHLMPAAESAPV